MSEVTAEKSGGEQTPTGTATIIHLQQACAHWKLSLKFMNRVVIFAGNKKRASQEPLCCKLEQIGVRIHNFLNLDCRSFARVCPRAFMHENE